MIEKKKGSVRKVSFLLWLFSIARSEMCKRVAQQHVGDASAWPSPHELNQAGGELVNLARPAGAGQKPSFSDVVRPMQATNILPIAHVADVEKELPSCPLTAFLRPDTVFPQMKFLMP